MVPTGVSVPPCGVNGELPYASCLWQLAAVRRPGRPPAMLTPARSTSSAAPAFGGRQAPRDELAAVTPSGGKRRTGKRRDGVHAHPLHEIGSPGRVAGARAPM